MSRWRKTQEADLAFNHREGSSVVSEPSVTRLVTVSILETVSFVALLAMMLAGNESAVSIVGMVHGLLFLAYAGLVVMDRLSFGWSWGFTALAILSGPIGAIVVLERLRRRYPTRIVE